MTDVSHFLASYFVADEGIYVAVWVIFGDVRMGELNEISFRHLLIPPLQRIGNGRVRRVLGGQSSSTKMALQGLVLVPKDLAKFDGRRPMETNLRKYCRCGSGCTAIPVGRLLAYVARSLGGRGKASDTAV